VQQHGDQGVVKTVVQVATTLQSNKSQLKQELQLLLEHFTKHRKLSMQTLANVFILSTDVQNVDKQMGEFKAALDRCLEADKHGRLLEHVLENPDRQAVQG